MAQYKELFLKYLNEGYYIQAKQHLHYIDENKILFLISIKLLCHLIYEFCKL